jgi:RNA polymerase sigma factor (sigma-70 family)
MTPSVYGHNECDMDDRSLSVPSGDDSPGTLSSSPEDVRSDADHDTGIAVARWQRAARSFESWRDGDPRAIDELVRVMTPVLWHHVRSYGLPKAAAEDVIQTTWLTLVRKNGSITHATAVYGWLSTTARREAWRVSRIDRRADSLPDDELEGRLPTQRAAEEDVAERDTSHRLWSAVQTLNERCQRLLRIVAFDDRPDYAQIAADLHMPMGSIGPTRQRCLAKLRAKLDSDLRDGGTP